MRLKKLGTASGISIVLLLIIPATVVLAAVPTIVTLNADISGIDITLNGEITNTGVAGDDDIRGFVWDTASHANPGNTAPGASAYSDNWTEAGSFGTGVFDHEETGLVSVCIYYYRACAHSADGWAYGDEVVFMTGEDEKTYFEVRLELDEAKIAGHGSPTNVQVGIFDGYSLPIWDAGGNVNEELYFISCIPNRWDGESHILLHIITALANANEAGNSYQLQVEWEHVTPNEEEIPVTTHTTTFTRTIESNTQYECYEDPFLIIYNADVGDDILPDDQIAIRLRRIDVGGQLTELDGELIILHWGILVARGDLLGDPEGWIDDLIEDETLIGGANLIYLFLGLIALGLTWAMFQSRNMMLGFPAAIFWAILGGYAYTESTTAWGDWQFYLAFACLLGMTTFSAFAAYGLRTKKGEEKEGEGFIDEGREDIRFIDEGEPEEGISRQVRKVRDNADRRRTKGIRRPPRL